MSSEQEAFSKRKLVRTLSGTMSEIPPIWLMRQAGRYLPEYRELRKQAGGFLDLCFTPRLAVEATMQPIRRFGFDAAIVFSDILVVPHCLGQEVSFIEGVGPKLEPIDSPEGLAVVSERLDLEALSPVFEVIEQVRSLLSNETALIGFCGAPWTVASYMIAGRGTPDQAPARRFAYKYPGVFKQLIDQLTVASVEYLCAQIKAGADVVQVFDSWCGVLPGLEFEEWCFRPLRRIVAGVKERHTGSRIIVFPRGAGLHLKRFSSMAGVDCIGLDTSVPVDWAAKVLQPSICVQGNLDPIALVVGGDALDRSADFIVESLGSGSFVFNLGHGILPRYTDQECGEAVKSGPARWLR